jgi:hypothetical protein
LANNRLLALYWICRVLSDGTIAESATSNLSIVTRDGVFKTPKFGDILAGTTVRAAMGLAREEQESGSGLISDVQQTDVTLDEVMVWFAGKPRQRWASVCSRLDRHWPLEGFIRLQHNWEIFQWNSFGSILPNIAI